MPAARAGVEVGGGLCGSGLAPDRRTAVSSSLPGRHFQKGRTGDAGLALERLGIPFLCPQERSLSTHAHDANVPASSEPARRVRARTRWAASAPPTSCSHAVGGDRQQSSTWGPGAGGVLGSCGGQP